LFLLRGLLRCSRCGWKMTTSTSRALADPSGKNRVTDATPRYYRCRGPSPCPGSHVSAQDLEQRVIEWFRHPTGAVAEHARKVLGLVARRWDGYARERRLRILAQLVWEIRWDGPKDRFRVLLDETTIEETHLGLEMERVQGKSNAKPSGDERRPRRRARGG
jgi:hypothetical protein